MITRLSIRVRSFGYLLLFLSSALLVRAERIPLSLQRAVELAVLERGNATVRLSEEQVSRAEADAALIRSGWFPQVGAHVIDQNRTVNLEAFGIRGGPGFQPPKLVGPFTTFDARATVRQSLLDLRLYRSYQASRAGVRAARQGSEASKDQAAAETARAYLEALSANAVLETALAEVRLAEELLQLAESQKAAGTGTGIEITRARVQLSVAVQEKLQAENALRQAHLLLISLIGLDLSAEIRLTDSLSRPPFPEQSLEQALQTALAKRRDLQAQRQKLERATLHLRSARMQRIPTLHGFADYGSIGESPSAAIPTWTLGITLDLPVFEGGAMLARQAGRWSELRQEQIRLDDLTRRIELEVRLALQTLSVLEQQVGVSEENVRLADSELEQAARRYRAGVTTGLEVTGAQARLMTARQGWVSALHNYNLARINLLDAMGILRETL